MRLLPCLLAVGLIFGLSACSFVRAADEEKDKQVATKDIPKAVQKAVKKLFPGAEVLRATKEEEGDDEEVYEIEIELNKQRIDVTVDEEGEVESFEKQIKVKSLKEAVVNAIQAKYPQATIKSAEELWEVDDGEQELECYEVAIQTTDKKSIEVQVSPKGKIKDHEKKEEAKGKKGDGDGKGGKDEEERGEKKVQSKKEGAKKDKDNDNDEKQE
jgi:Peptidase propeptide and YPEB domain